MLNLSIMPLDGKHVDECTRDIIECEKNGTFTHAMLTMYLQPEGTPPKEKARIQCEVFDKYKEILEPEGAKFGVLVQSTMGHISPPPTPHPFQPTVSLVTGEERMHTCCPLDPNFREHMKAEMRELAKHSPSIVMLDDDVGLIYRDLKGCACPLHMAEFNRRAGTSLTREELYLHTQGEGELDKKYTSIYVDTVRDSLVGFVKAMREGLDEVNPKIQGIVSGIYVTTFTEFSGDIADAFAGEGNPRIARLNGGMYTAQGPRFFSKNMFRAAILRENAKNKIDIFLAETDTCPQNRYSTSAALLHAHFSAMILEGAKGAKHWITRMGAFEPKSGLAYRRVLTKYRDFYEKLSEIYDTLTPFGCRIPLSLTQDYGLKPQKSRLNTSAWSTCVIERLGLPLYFGNTEGGAVFLDDFSVNLFSDAEITEFLKGTLILSGGALEELTERGFSAHLGVRAEKYIGKSVSGEVYNGKNIAKQKEGRRLVPLTDKTAALSNAVHRERGCEPEILYPASTVYENSLGGMTVAFSGNPDTPFNYYSAFSFLSETRKEEFIDILRRGGHLPVYYPDDAEMYLRCGKLPGGEIFAAAFNLGLDELDELPLALDGEVLSVEKLNEAGERVPVAFELTSNGITVKERMSVLIPLVLFISMK